MVDGFERESARRRELVSFVRPEWKFEAQVCVCVCVCGMGKCACVQVFWTVPVQLSLLLH